MSESLPIGAHFISETRGQVGGVPDQPTSRSGFEVTEDGLVVMAPEFASGGSSNYTLHLYLGGDLVFSQVGLNGSPGTLVAGSKPKRCHYKPLSCTWTIGHLTEAAELLMSDGTTITADRMEMTADEPAEVIEFLSQVRLTTQWVESFSIVEESNFSLPVITSSPASQTVTPGQPVVLEVSATGGESLSYRWRYGGETLDGEIQPRLVLDHAHSRDAGLYDVVVSDRGFDAVSGSAAVTISFPTVTQLQLQDGVLTVVGTPGSERIAVRSHPTDPTQIEFDSLAEDGQSISVQFFPASSIQKLDVDLGPGYDELIIELTGLELELDNGTGDGILIADARGLPLARRPDGIIDFGQLREAFAPLTALTQAHAELLAQAAALREQGMGILQNGLDLVHLANTNLVDLAVKLATEATGSLYADMDGLKDQFARLAGVAQTHLTAAEAGWTHANEPSYGASELISLITSMAAEASGYTNRLERLSRDELENLSVELAAADEASLGALLSSIEGKLSDYEVEAGQFQSLLDEAYIRPAATLDEDVEREVTSPGERLADVLAVALEERLARFEVSAEQLVDEAEGNVQSRADALTAASAALEALASNLELQIGAMEAKIDALFANVPNESETQLASLGVSQVNCFPKTKTLIAGSGCVFGTPWSDRMFVFGGCGFGFNGNDRIQGSFLTEILFGGRGNDAIRGFGGMDLIFGGPGDDCLKGGRGHDIVLGGDGDDEIQGEAGTDLLFGGDGADTIEGNGGLDVVLGGNGPDNISGHAASDFLFGGAGMDLIEGGNGTTVNFSGQSYHLGNLILGQGDDDVCNGGKGIDVIAGNGEEDILNGRQNIDIMFGGPGNDAMHGEDGGVLLSIVVKGVKIKIRFGNLMFGGGQDDTMDAGSDLDILFGNLGNDSLSGADGTHAVLALANDLYFGGPGLDTIEGSRVGADWIFGGPDADDAEGDDGHGSAAPYFDFIYGGRGADTLRGGHGMDLAFGGQGDDTIHGGDGLFDLLFGGDGSDTINGEASFDLIFGGADDDDIDGGNFFDLCFGGTGDDHVKGGDGPDGLFGQSGDDLVEGGRGFDLCFGNRGNDRVRGGEDSDLILGGNGEDECHGDDGFDLVFGNNDADIVHGNLGPDLCFGGPGPDCAFGDEGSDICFGGMDNDLVDGGSGWDICLGNEGYDEVHGGTGNDILLGGAGDDKLSGGDDADLLLGGDGQDKVFGGSGLDLLFGNSGDDVLNGEGGVGLLFGGDGNDWVYGGPDTDIAFGGDGNDILFGEFGSDLLFGGQGDDCADGGNQSDIIFCGDGDDRAWGRDGNDVLFGESGNDTLAGGAGNDLLLGGPGSDDLYGGPGFDILLSGTKHPSGDVAGGCPDAPCSELYGGKWRDLDGDGVHDAGEPWLPGVTIYLDLNGNGVLDAGEPSTITGVDDPATPKVDETGKYCFMRLTPGVYLVREVTPTGLVQSYPTAGAPHVANLGLFATVWGLDFGNRCAFTEPLKLLEATPRCGTNKLFLTFSGPLDLATALNSANYSIPGQTILSVTLVDPQTVCLELSNPIAVGSGSVVTVHGVKDQCGNTFDAGETSMRFRCPGIKLIQIVRDHSGRLVLIWDPAQGVLECSTDLNTWVEVPGATSPYVIPVTGSQYQFYRLK